MFDQALAFARTLTLIPDFPRFEEALMATAEDLVNWCKGAFIEGIVWAPESQAAWLVREARRKMTKWTGTAELLAIFHQKFPSIVKPGNGFVDYSNEPCICGSGKKFKDCHKGKALPPLPDWPSFQPIEPKSPPPPPNRLKPITQDDIDKLLRERDGNKP